MGKTCDLCFLEQVADAQSPEKSNECEVNKGTASVWEVLMCTVMVK